MNKNLALQLMAIAASMLTGQDFNAVATAVAVPKCGTPTPRKRNTTTTRRQPVSQTQKFNCEPDGVKIIVDRPRRENYRSQAKWAADMANYRCLIDQAKKCDGIKTCIPADVPADVHNNRRDWYEDHGCVTAPQMPMPQFGCIPCGCNNGWGW